LVATGNIYIDPGVKELDGVYIAKNDDSGDKGNIYTCSVKTGGTFTPEPAKTLYSNCDNQLTVVGSFVADQVNLMRTYGTLKNSTTGTNCDNKGVTSSTRPTCAAEVFDFSPEVYLSNPAIESQGGNGGATQYDSIESLPPVL